MTISKYTPAGSRPNWNRMTTPSKIRLISSGGLAKAFSVFMSPGVMESRADLASSRAGPAAARSFSASAFPAATTAASLANTSFTAVTSAFFFSAYGGAERNALVGEGPQRRPQRRLGRQLEGAAKAVGGGYKCH